MKQTLLKILGCFMLGGILASIVIGGFKYYKYQEHERMVEIVKSPEAQKAIWNATLNVYKHSNSHVDRIKKLIVNEKYIQKSPAGDGITVEVDVNGNKNYYIRGDLYLNRNNQYLYSIGIMSDNINDLLK